MENATEPKPEAKGAKRRGRGKVTPRVRAETEVLRVAPPKGSQFKGYEPYQLQDLVLTARVLRYRRERWLTPEGETMVAPLPDGIRGHFGPELRRFVPMQHHQGQVTVERLVTQLQAIGVSISKRQVMRLLIDHALAGTLVQQLATHEQRRFAGKSAWMSHLEQLGITGLQVASDPVRVATEGALWGAVSAHGFLCEAVLLSDDAGQFNVGQHALCWIHAECLVHKLKPFTARGYAPITMLPRSWRDRNG